MKTELLAQSFLKSQLVSFSGVTRNHACLPSGTNVSEPKYLRANSSSGRASSSSGEGDVWAVLRADGGDPTNSLTGQEGSDLVGCHGDLSSTSLFPHRKIPF